MEYNIIEIVDDDMGGYLVEQDGKVEKIQEIDAKVGLTEVKQEESQAKTQAIVEPVAETAASKAENELIQESPSVPDTI